VEAEGGRLRLAVRADGDRVDRLVERDVMLGAVPWTYPEAGEPGVPLGHHEVIAEQLGPRPARTESSGRCHRATGPGGRETP